MTTTFRSYRDLEVWKRSMMLAKQIYQVTSRFPSDERFGLSNQLRRAAVSISSNLAEGHARSVQPSSAGSYQCRWAQSQKLRPNFYWLSI
jgi:hypothetical protein